MWQTRVSYVDGAYITLVNTELGFRLFKLGILNFWFRISNTRIAPLVGFCGALPCFDSIRRCAPLIRFCGAIVSYDGELRSHGRFGGAIMWCGPEVVKGDAIAIQTVVSFCGCSFIRLVIFDLVSGSVFYYF